MDPTLTAPTKYVDEVISSAFEQLLTILRDVNKEKISLF